jgi:hypothetical protein
MKHDGLSNAGQLRHKLLELRMAQHATLFAPMDAPSHMATTKASRARACVRSRPLGTPVEVVEENV